MSAGDKQVCLVTGASRGVGRAVAKTVASKGLYVVLVARSLDQLTDLLQQIKEDGGDGMVAMCCITDREAVKRMAAQVLKEVGVPDFIVNNAGAWAFQDFCDRDYASWDWMIDVNIKGHLNIIGEFLPAMKERNSGHIINITSDSERVPFAGVSVYTGTKFFMAGCMQSLRMELKGTDIRITNVLPGFIWTDGIASTMNNPVEREAMQKFGFGDPEDYIKNKDLMLQPSDLGDCVWTIISNPSNYYVYDVMLRDKLQEM